MYRRRASSRHRKVDLATAWHTDSALEAKQAHSPTPAPKLGDSHDTPAVQAILLVTHI